MIFSKWPLLQRQKQKRREAFHTMLIMCKLAISYPGGTRSGGIGVTECRLVNQFRGSAQEPPGMEEMMSRASLPSRPAFGVRRTAHNAAPNQA